jgi:hypothetical protein
MSAKPSGSKPNRGLVLGLSGIALALVAGLCLIAMVAGGVIYFLRQPETTEPAVAYVLDTSQRMGLPAKGVEGQSRLGVAEAILAEVIRPAEPSLTSGMRVFGGGFEPEACRDTHLRVPYAASNQTRIADELSGLSTGPAAEAALDEAMLAAIREVSKYRGPHWMVVITGGAGSCNPEAATLIAQEVERSGIALQMFVVGYQVTEQEAQAIKALIEETPGAAFLSAPDADTLRDIISAIQNYINVPSESSRADVAAAATAAMVAAVPASPTPEATRPATRRPPASTTSPATLTPAPTEPPTEAAFEWAGTWNLFYHLETGVTIQTTTFILSGNTLTYNFEDEEGIVNGIISADGLSVSGTWENFTFGTTGTFEWRFVDDNGYQFIGYSRMDGLDDQSWCGYRTGVPPPDPCLWP